MKSKHYFRDPIETFWVQPYDSSASSARGAQVLGV